jgi:bifunctional NMN adenylyltransferase/nudix hydrolase
MPGGFVEKNERFLDAAMRELREEVRLKVPEAVLRGSIVNRRIFDDPHRSERGRLVTECFHVKLVNEHGKLPKFKGSEDPNEVDEVLWVDIADLRREDFFEDHYFIISYMLGLGTL